MEKSLPNPISNERQTTWVEINPKYHMVKKDLQKYLALDDLLVGTEEQFFATIHRDTDERATHRSPPRAAAETKLSKVTEAPTGILAKSENRRTRNILSRVYPPTDLLSGVFRWSAGFATEPAAQSPAKAQVYPGHSKAKEPVADQPLQRADVPSTRPGTDSEPVRKQVHVGVNPVVLLGFTVAVLSQYTRTLRRTNPVVSFRRVYSG
ncbi:hypothetical protein NQ315_014621 [Exocentrus adspersus]|uniref:Uncharacterized protein n=1 Tax=Exocentrus adspersus TaxID=1586481 RepID=A0AAV8VQL0_9CUCU|nr:hypothetical protein NQ315_014621 [Exocentrus adspersus]